MTATDRAMCTEAENRIRQLERLLRRYGRHCFDCDLIVQGAIRGGECDCGWDDVDPDRSPGASDENCNDEETT